jgi:hypothetical protein
MASLDPESALARPPIRSQGRRSSTARFASESTKLELIIAALSAVIFEVIQAANWDIHNFVLRGRIWISIQRTIAYDGIVAFVIIQ